MGSKGQLPLDFFESFGIGMAHHRMCSSLFFLLTVQNSSFPSSPPKKYMQCHQAVDPGDMYYGRSFINSGKSRGPRTLP